MGFEILIVGSGIDGCAIARKASLLGAPAEVGSLPAFADALRLTAAAPPHNNNAGGDQE